jgi:flagellar assembly factor FliW
MKLTTKRFGTIQVRKEDRLTIPGGLLGLEGLEQWVFHHTEGFNLFRWLQSVDIPEVALIVAPARAIRPDFHAEVTDVDLEPLDLADGDELDCLVVLREPTDCSRMTANLLGPIVVNTRNRRGVQVVLHDSDYCPAHQVVTGLSPKTEAA